MKPERAQELAEQLGLSRPPAPRYDDLPMDNAEMGRLVNFRKAIMLVDRILTSAFWPFIPDECVIDNMMDATSYSPGNCFCSMVRTDVPPPVNQKITRVTGMTKTLETRNFLLWMGIILKEHWTALRPRSMAPPLLFQTRGDPKVPGARPAIGLCMKFDLRPPDGSSLDEIFANYGAIVPGGTKIKDGHRVLAVPEPEDRVVEFSAKRPKKTRR